ncbi:MAG: fructokinase [Anaerolineales bacterium]|nr:ROK family protein [Anaerolineae bacterium]PWB51455.1 MAG: fructokinase [Anaerolineales bacterium]
MSTGQFYGGIEGGGTKFICMVASDPGSTIDEVRFVTTTPQETLEQVCAFFTPYIKAQRIKSIGLGSFGPVDTDPSSPTFGYITTTPKPNWAFTNILGILQGELKVPIAIDMDVAASALGEYRWGASRGIDPSLYLTVGTGIGGSYILNGKPLRGLVSLEMGHVYIPHNRQRDPFPGSCPYHGDCFEGLANGPAIHKRFNQFPESLADQDPFWEIEAGYIAYALVNYIFTFPPKKIVVGGGVMHRLFLFDLVRHKVSSLLNNYLNHPTLTGPLDEYIVPPGLGYRSGVLGGIALAMELEKQP